MGLIYGDYKVMKIIHMETELNTNISDVRVRKPRRLVEGSPTKDGGKYGPILNRANCSI